MREVALRSLAADGGLVGGPFGSSLVGRDYAPTGVPVIRGTNLGHGKMIGGEYVYVSREKVIKDLSRNTAIPGDLIFTQRGTLGQVAIVPGSGHDQYVVSQSQMRLRVDSNTSAAYVYYACSASQFKRQIADSAISTGVPHINLGILSRLKIPIRTLAKQRAIAEVLGALDNKIAANHKLVTIADQLAVATTQAAIDPDTPTTTLAQLAEVTMGSSPNGASYNEDGNGVIFFQGIRDFGVRYPSARVWTTAPVRMAQQGDCLVSVRAPVGRVNLAGSPLCIGRGLASVRALNGCPYTLFQLLNCVAETWGGYEGHGTVFGSINRDQLKSVQLPTVSASEANALEARLRALENSMRSALVESKILGSTRDTLLPHLMSGRLRVRDAEKIVGERL